MFAIITINYIYSRAVTANTDVETILKSPLGTVAHLIREELDNMDQARMQSMFNWIGTVPDKSKIEVALGFQTGTVNLSLPLSLPLPPSPISFLCHSLSQPF